MSHAVYAPCVMCDKDFLISTCSDDEERIFCSECEEKLFLEKIVKEAKDEEDANVQSTINSG